MSSEEENPGYIDILVECRFCGGLVPDDFECIKCGAELLEEEHDGIMIYACSICREHIEEDTLVCPRCGTRFG